MNGLENEIMDLYLIYKYAYWGAIEKLKTLTKLYNMCLEVSDGDAAEEYEIEIEKKFVNNNYDNKSMLIK